MALALIARLVDHEAAERVATAMEYEWHRDSGWDPFAKNSRPPPILERPRKTAGP
jgi:hypothetical protein